MSSHNTSPLSVDLMLADVVLMVQVKRPLGSRFGRREFSGVAGFSGATFRNKSTKSGNFIVIGPQNPVFLDRCLAAVDPATFRPAAELLMTHLKCSRKISEPPFICDKKFIV